MTIKAVRIGSQGTTEALDLPDAYPEQRKMLRDLLGGTVDAGAYHRRARVHALGEGALTQLDVYPRRSLDLLICGSSRDSRGGRSPRFEMSSHEARENGRCV
jgi:hypothetical protein